MKPTYINIDDGMLLDYHQELMNEMYHLYHIHPTNIPHMEISSSERAEMASLEQEAKALENKLKQDRVALQRAGLRTEARESESAIQQAQQIARESRNALQQAQHMDREAHMNISAMQGTKGREAYLDAQGIDPHNKQVTFYRSHGEVVRGNTVIVPGKK